MVYMLKVDMLVAGMVFAVAGVFMLGMFAWIAANNYARALWTIARSAAVASRERVAISRVNSRNQNADSFRAA